MTEYHHVTITSDATRLAAILSGEVDMLLFTPAQDIARLRQDPRIRVVEGIENRTVFLGRDQARDELPFSDVKGRNPFKDVRARRAIAMALDMDVLDRPDPRHHVDHARQPHLHHVPAGLDRGERGARVRQRRPPGPTQPHHPRRHPIAAPRGILLTAPHLSSATRRSSSGCPYGLQEVK